MSWFNTSGFASLAKSALSQAQKTIDKALDIREQEEALAETKSKSPVLSTADDTDDFFAAFGLDEKDSAHKLSKQPATSKENTLKVGQHLDENISSIWGSFTGSFFDTGGSGKSNVQDPESTVTDTNVTIESQPKKPTHKQRLRTVSLGDSSGNTIVLPERLIVSESVPELSEAIHDEKTAVDSLKVTTLLQLKVKNQDVGRTSSNSKKINDLSQNQSREVHQMIEDTQECQISIMNKPNHVSSSENEIPFLTQSEVKVEESVKASKKFDNESDSKLQAVMENQIRGIEKDMDINKRVINESLSAIKTVSTTKQEKKELSVGKRLDSGNLMECETSEAGAGLPESVYSTDTLHLKESETTETLPEHLISQPLEDPKVSSSSFISLSSSSTTGESSSTLDESMGTLSVLSEKDGPLSSHSSTTLTPELFSESGDIMPVGMSSSWDLGDGSADYTPIITVEDNSKRETKDGANVSEIAENKPDLDSTLTEESDQTIEYESDVQKKDDHQNLDPQQSAQNTSSKRSLQGTSHVLKDKIDRSPSLVSYMLEEAMVESASGVIGHPVSTSSRAYSPNSSASSTSSNAERSDPVKTTESEQNSGQTSGDEVETTTSSDIEIISSPSMGGESGCERGGSISPIKATSGWRSKTNNFRGISSTYHGGSIRSESPSSDASSTKECHAYPASAVIIRPDLTFTPAKTGKSKHQRSISEISLEESDGHQARIEALMKKVSDISSILEVREGKVLELSHENMNLKERLDFLQAQLQKAEEVHAADTRDVSTLTKELTERLSSTEKKLQQAVKEKETFKRELQQATVEIASRVSATQVEEIKKEKDSQIAELMQEGESLSKKVLQYSNNVKKLRAKEKENENHIKQQREKIEEQSRELERVRKAISAKEEVEKNQIELIRQLTNTVNKQEKEICSLKSDLEDAQEKQRSMKSAMESAYKELAELHRRNAEKDSQAQEAALSAEMSAKEELRIALEKLQHESRLQQDTLIFQIEELQASLSRNEKQAALREDALRQDIANLQQRLQEAEGRNDELNQNVSAATRPLLRQIDNLQSTLNIQTSSWERVERNLTDRLNETQKQLGHATEKERAIAEKYADVSSKVASLEAQCSLLRQEKAKLLALFETTNAELQLSKETMAKDTASLATLKHAFREEIASIKRERDMLEHQLEIEKTALEAEKRKTSLLQDQMKEKDHRLAQQSINFEGSQLNSPSPQSSMRGSFSEQLQSSWFQDDASESSMTFPPNPNRMNVYESLRAGSLATMLDSLQSQLKLRDGDISQLQNDIGQLERVKESMTEELVKMNAKNEELESEIVALRDQQTNFQDMKQKYNALLQMYGEKVEEAEELRLDLEDVKEMYKAQIDELLRRK